MYQLRSTKYCLWWIAPGELPLPFVYRENVPKELTSSLGKAGFENVWRHGGEKINSINSKPINSTNQKLNKRYMFIIS